jgi:hypothetical protein
MKTIDLVGCSGLNNDEDKQRKIKGSNKPDDDETPLLVGHIPEKHYQSLQPKGKVNINCDNIF